MVVQVISMFLLHAALKLEMRTSNNQSVLASGKPGFDSHDKGWASSSLSLDKTLRGTA